MERRLSDIRPTVHVLIPAAGGGSRMAIAHGGNKLLLPVGGVSVLARTLSAFLSHAAAAHVLLVIPAGEAELFRAVCQSLDGAARVTMTTGGHTRQESVRLGLEFLARTADREDLVLIQDGARCFTDHATIDRCLAAAAATGACCAAVPLKDTVKEADGDGLVIATPDRERLWQVQTPQAFRFGLILDAYRQAQRKGDLATDDASLVEGTGHPVRLVKGSYLNIKITTPEDLLLGQAIAAAQDRQPI